jgi:Do/DeqQ family serine protease
MRRFALVLFAATLAAPALAQTEVPPSRAAIEFSFAPVVKRVEPAVVNVYATRVVQRPANPLFDDPLFRQFFGQGQNDSRIAESLGSGVIVDPSGLVVTNNHVIDGMTDVKVALSDRREFPAKIVLRDPKTDLAVLRIEGGSNFPVLPFGDSDRIEIGDLVLAVGDPFGVGQTVTQGIVSALARTQIGPDQYGFFIQTDAAINPGNSGGALVDMNAHLIGLNSEIYSRSGGSMGIGFAIPVNMVKVVVDAAKSGDSEVRHPWVGASLQDVSSDIASSLGMVAPEGALVADVTANGPAARAGLRTGDVITAVDDLPVEDSRALDYRIATRPLGGAVALKVLRDGQTKVLSMRLEAPPETPPRDQVQISGDNPLAGGAYWNVSPAVADDLSLNNVSKGVVVADVQEGSNAAAVGLQKGDVIVAVNNVKIATTRELQQATNKQESYWKLSVDRGGQMLTSIIGG